jgi:hypothetical protein
MRGPVPVIATAAAHVAPGACAGAHAPASAMGGATMPGAWHGVRDSAVRAG